MENIDVESIIVNSLKNQIITLEAIVKSKDDTIKVLSEIINNALKNEF